MNFDPELWTVLREVAHLSRPPLSRGIPPRLQQLVAALDLPALQQRQAGLTSLLQAYHDLQDSLTSVERTLFQDKLTRAEQVCTYMYIYVHVHNLIVLEPDN